MMIIFLCFVSSCDLKTYFFHTPTVALEITCFFDAHAPHIALKKFKTPVATHGHTPSKYKWI